LADPNETLDAAALWERFWTEIVVTGNGILWKQRDRGPSGKDIRQLWPVDTRHVQIMQDRERLVAGYVFDPAVLTGTGQAMAQAFPTATAQRYSVADILHLRLSPDPDYPLWGYSPLAAALSEIDLDNAITEFTTALMENGAVTTHVFTTKNPVDETEIERIGRRWKQRRGGPTHAGELVVIDGTEGALTRAGLAIGSREMGLADLRKQIEARILSALNVPPIVVGAVVGLENATYSNYMQARLAFHEENTDPNLRRIQSVFTKGLAREFGPALRIRHDLSRVMGLQEWETGRRRLALAEYAGGIATQNEARADVDRPPLEGGDITLAGLNMQVLPASVRRVTQRPPITSSMAYRLRGALGRDLAALSAEIEVRAEVMEYLRAAVPMALDGEPRIAAAWRLLHAAHTATVSAALNKADGKVTE